MAAVAVVLSLAAWSRPSARVTVNAVTDSPQVPRLVFVLQPGPGGGGGGGGNRQPRPPSRARAIGDDRLTVPIVRRVETQAPANDVVPRKQQVQLDAKPLAAGSVFMTGLLEASPSLPFSRGSGRGEGVGSGTGSGIGSGAGSGMGSGSGGGFGGGAYRLGSGVTPPTLLKQVTPKYTAEAMRHRIHGVVALEVVINRDGIPTAIRVTRPLDPGLDGEAVAAALQWRFAPGRVGNTPVDVLVTILLDFNIR
ncbi:MAG TPA: energy transducer TonB [Vicinamibacterales bacterium]|nr:energy transducer TonB [Vicinamibacterales bacterium]